MRIFNLSNRKKGRQEQDLLQDILPIPLRIWLLLLLELAVPAFAMYFWDELAAQAGSIGHERLASICILLSAALATILLSWAYLIFRYWRLRKDLLARNPTHFYDQEFEGWFDEREQEIHKKNDQSV